jgi:hypothetical protein
VGQDYSPERFKADHDSSQTLFCISHLLAVNLYIPTQPQSFTYILSNTVSKHGHWRRRRQEWRQGENYRNTSRRRRLRGIARGELFREGEDEMSRTRDVVDLRDQRSRDGWLVIICWSGKGFDGLDWIV